MDDRAPGSSPDALEITVDGVRFEVTHDPEQPGAYHYSRLTPPAEDYGFTSRGSDHAERSTEQHVDSIRNFLSLVDPETGYIEDYSRWELFVRWWRRRRGPSPRRR
ncbi:hypothetical protein [Nocardioides plantarum]|uniref:Uncharacterized protein n=1 Tax=Nocardioides plantarum TaxID=29299 RepID=A0ABV5KAA8_9ACTN|nr:hypothetical protein [Nocardioides plantarum]